MIFTEFVLPSGTRKMRVVEVGDKEAHRVVELERAGYRFEIEELTTGDTYMDCCDDDEQLADLLIRGTDGVVGATERLINFAYEEWSQRGKPEANP